MLLELAGFKSVLQNFWETMCSTYGFRSSWRTAACRAGTTWSSSSRTGSTSACEWTSQNGESSPCHAGSRFNDNTVATVNQWLAGPSSRWDLVRISSHQGAGMTNLATTVNMDRSNQPLATGASASFIDLSLLPHRSTQKFPLHLLPFNRRRCNR